MKFGLKWVHMARYELILRLDGALWLTIIFKPLLTPQRAFTIQFESYFWMFVTENVSMIWNVSVWGTLESLNPIHSDKYNNHTQVNKQLLSVTTRRRSIFV